MFELRCGSYMKLIKLQVMKMFQLFHPKFIHDNFITIIIQLNIGWLPHIWFYKFMGLNLFYCYLIEFFKGLFLLIMLFQ